MGLLDRLRGRTPPAEPPRAAPAAPAPVPEQRGEPDHPAPAEAEPQPAPAPARWRAVPRDDVPPPTLQGVRVQPIVDAAVALGLTPSRPVPRESSAGPYAIATLADDRFTRLVTVTTHDGGAVSGVHVSGDHPEDAVRLIAAVLGAALGPDAPQADPAWIAARAAEDAGVVAAPDHMLLTLVGTPEGRRIAVLSTQPHRAPATRPWGLAHDALRAHAEALGLREQSPAAWVGHDGHGRVELSWVELEGAIVEATLHRELEREDDAGRTAACEAASDLLAAADGGPPPPPAMVLPALGGGALEGERVRAELTRDAGPGGASYVVIVEALAV